VIVAESHLPRSKEYVISCLYPQHLVLYLKYNGGRGAGGGAELNSKSKVYLEKTKAVCLKLREQEKDSKLKMLPGVRLWPTLMAR